MRQFLKKQRKNLSQKQRMRYATLASLQLPKIKHLLPKHANVGLYQDAFGELPSYPIMHFCQKNGHTPFLPVISHNHLQFVRILPKNHSNMALDVLPCKRHKFGMNEPIGNHICVSRLHAVFCPLVMIDQNGHRVGMGGGFYDRTLRQYHGIKIGYCYDFQVVKHMTKNPWDIGMDYIITDKRLIVC